jgi:hypothetical protein
MLICQPPVKQVTASYPAPCTGTRKLTIRNEDGVTIGDVLKGLRKAPDLTTDLRAISLYSSVSFKGGFLVNSLARSVAERSAELSSEDDPTRLVARDEPWVAGRFPFTSPR